MNTLSWMIYGASLAQSVGSLSLALVFLGLGGGILCCGIGYMHADTCSDREAASVRAIGRRSLRIGVAIAIPKAIVATIVPDQKTVLMIAASQAGQRVYDDPANQPVISALREAITAKLKEASK